MNYYVAFLDLIDLFADTKQSFYLYLETYILRKDLTVFNNNMSY